MGTADVISCNMAWGHKCTIAWFDKSEAKNPEWMYLLPGRPRS